MWELTIYVAIVLLESKPTFNGGAIINGGAQWLITNKIWPGVFQYLLSGRNLASTFKSDQMRQALGKGAITKQPTSGKTGQVQPHEIQYRGALNKLRPLLEKQIRSSLFKKRVARLARQTHLGFDSLCLSTWRIEERTRTKGEDTTTSGTSLAR